MRSALPRSLKSSTSTISAISSGGERFSTLWTVRRREDQPSLWKGMMMLVLGRVSRYRLLLQLEGDTGDRKRTGSALILPRELRHMVWLTANPTYSPAFRSKGKLERPKSHQSLFLLGILKTCLQSVSAHTLHRDRYTRPQLCARAVTK